MYTNEELVELSNERGPKTSFFVTNETDTIGTAVSTSPVSRFMIMAFFSLARRSVPYGQMYWKADGVSARSMARMVNWCTDACSTVMIFPYQLRGLDSNAL